jgi:transposase
MVDTETGELSERRLAHREQAEQFYQELKQKNLAVRVGMEASGHSRWFERLLRNLEFELWIGDAAEIRTKRVRKQKTDRQDAQLLLQLLLESRFPRIWVPDAAISCMWWH